MVSTLLGTALALTLAALPPPPSKVVRQTKVYGVVTLDHAAHLARKIRCKSCHGPGPVRPIEFTPKLAHDTCRGCHVAEQRGPTQCRGCHVVPVTTSSAIAGVPPTPDGAAPAGTVAAASPASPRTPADAPGAPSPAAPGDRIRTVEIETRRSARDSADLGVVTLIADGRVMVGPVLEVFARGDRTVVSFSLAVPRAADHGRTQLLVGGGSRFPVGESVNAWVMGIAGLYAAHDAAALLPSVGVRAGLEMPTRKRVIETLACSLTALGEYGRGARGERTKEFAASLAVSARFQLGKKK